MPDNKPMTGSYARFALMMAVSFVMMYAIMFINVFEIDHIRLSLTRTYMALLMVCPMAVMMLLFMWNMYRSKRHNYMILGIAAVVFCLSLYGLRTQTPIGDIQWMKGMIPHHSSAIMTSTNADLKDPEVKRLAEDIIRQQEEEIAEMKAMIKRLEDKQ